MPRKNKKHPFALIKSNYDRSKFIFNEKRKQLLLETAQTLLDGFEPEVAKADYADIMMIVQLFEENKIDEALNKYRSLDTAVRDECPQWLPELSGAEINSFFYKKSESLETTE